MTLLYGRQSAGYDRVTRLGEGLEVVPAQRALVEAAHALAVYHQGGVAAHPAPSHQLSWGYMKVKIK